jgi:hypothetical protein
MAVEKRINEGGFQAWFLVVLPDLNGCFFKNPSRSQSVHETRSDWPN